MAKGRQLNKEEQSLWNNFASHIQVSKYSRHSHSAIDPIQSKKIVHPDQLVSSIISRVEKQTKPSQFIQQYAHFKQKQLSPRESFVEIGAVRPGLDTSTWKKLQKGEMRPEKILDLHGYTAQHAFFRLEEFIIQAQRNHVRCVEIITGRGIGYKEGGILKRELPYWLNRPVIQALILATTYPDQWHGGAVRILLKRNR